MFKALLLSLALASTGYAGISNTTPIENWNGGIQGPHLVPVGTPVYALNNALTGTTSATIDLSNTAGLWVGVTGAAAVQVAVYFSNLNLSYTTGAVQMYQINSAGNYPVPAKGRYVSFYNASNQPAARISLNYLPLVAPPTTVSGSSTVVFPAGSTVTAYQGTNPWIVSGTVDQGNGLPSATNAWKVDAIGSSVVAYAGTNPWPITGTVNASGFNFLSATVIATGLTTNAATTLSLTWAASTSTGPLFADLNCAGATGMNYVISNSATAPSGFVANSALFGYQPCGQISQVPLEANAGDTPHLHSVAVTLSNTSGALGVVTKQRP